MVTTNEPTVMAKSLLDLIVVESSQGNRGLTDPTSTNEGDWYKVLSEDDYFLNQLVTSKKGPWGQRRGFSGYATAKRKINGSVDGLNC